MNIQELYDLLDEILYDLHSDTISKEPINMLNYALHTFDEIRKNDPDKNYHLLDRQVFLLSLLLEKDINFRKFLNISTFHWLQKIVLTEYQDMMARLQKSVFNHCMSMEDSKIKKLIITQETNKLNPVERSIVKEDDPICDYPLEPQIDLSEYGKNSLGINKYKI